MVDIAASSQNAAAIDENGKIWVWGVSTHGEKAVPEMESKPVKIYGGRYHYTVLLENGDVVAWGDDQYGQASVPGSVEKADIAAIYAGGNQNYAVTKDGKVLTWGLKGFLCGTDDLGRDVLARIVNGGKMTMTVGAIAVIISTIIGLVLGGIGGLPFLPFALILSAVIPREISVLQRMYIIMCVLGVLSWVPDFRLVRAQIFSQREQEYVTAAKALGVREGHILRKHIIPNVMSVLLVSITLNFATCMLTESTLSYLGFGIPLPTPTWGNMLNSCNNSIVIQQYWWRWVFPAAVFGLCTICINLMGAGGMRVFIAGACGMPWTPRAMDAKEEETMALLETKNLHTYFKTRRGVVKAVNGVSYSIEPGKTLGVVGESGSGKSVSAMSILRLLDGNGYVDSGEIIFDGKDLTKIPMSEMYHIRGNKISVIFQEPMTALNPVFSVERQLSEPFIIHRNMSKKQAAEAAVKMLADVKIPNPEVVVKQYPHQLSGGMRQRVMIAMALACEPKLLIADEPTTALDVTIQAQILHLMNNLKEEHGTAIMFITHDLGVINQMADDVAVMYCGQVVEHVPARVLFAKNTKHSHPYTEGLLASVPRLDTKTDRLDAIPGAVPHPLDLPKGCKFAPRCKYCTKRCMEEEPELVKVGENQEVRCFYPEKEARHAK